MFEVSSRNALCFDDILLVPQRSTIESRRAVDLSMTIGKGKREIKLKLPVIAAPMDTVCDMEMCIAMHYAGGMGVIHRYMSHQQQISMTKEISGVVDFGVAIASNNGYMEQASKLYKAGARIFLIDTANGHGNYAVDAVRTLRNEFDDIHIMAGNVATAQGFADLAEAGADSVRVGIGGGSACTTRIVSGHGVPTLQSIIDVDEWRNYSKIDTCSIIADGGIKNSGDMVKAFAAGADAVMVGSMLAGTDEAPGEIFTDGAGRSVKSFRGMASREAQKDATGGYSVAEGISTTIPYKGSVRHILDDISGGLGSGCSYSGVRNLNDLSVIAEYITVSQASINESKPHAL